jgi:hypothetical protein
MIADNAKIFDSLEKRIEKVVERYRAASEENVKLKARVSESQAEIDRLKADLAASRKAGQKAEELASEVARQEEEKQKIRERISRLIETLETIDANEG